MSLTCIHCASVVPDSRNGQDTTTCPVCGSGLLDMSLRSIRNDEHQAFERFDLLERLGSGHFGNVWRAFDTRLQREVALKIPKYVGMKDADRKLFMREARSAAKLNHPGVVTVFEVGEEGDCVYIVTELLTGGSYQSYLRTHSPTVDAAVDQVVQIAKALEHAHDRSVIHRDLKPGNILMTDFGLLKVGDFGLAKIISDQATVDSDMTKEGSVLGTPAYMSPEQARGDIMQIDLRTDIYSLGVILYELLAKRRPFDTTVATFSYDLQTRMPLNPSLLNPEVSDTLAEIVMKCLAKKPVDRYSRTSELIHELVSWQKDRTTSNIAENVALQTVIALQKDTPTKEFTPQGKTAKEQVRSDEQARLDVVPTPDVLPKRESSPGDQAIGVRSFRDSNWSLKLAGVLALAGLVAFGGYSLATGLQPEVSQAPPRNTSDQSSSAEGSLSGNPQQVDGLAPVGVDRLDTTSNDPAADPSGTTMRSQELALAPASVNGLQVIPAPTRDAPTLRSVRLTTDPPGAKVVFYGMNPNDLNPDPQRRYPSEGESPFISPVNTQLPPGDYLVVVALDDNRFIEVFRRVPADPTRLADNYRHLAWAVVAEEDNPAGLIELRRVDIPVVSTAEMVELTGHDAFLIGTDTDSTNPKHTRKIPPFLIASRETTYGDLVQAGIKAQDIPSLHTLKDLPADQPLGGLFWNDAVVIAEVLGMRLMTEFEYEFAATNGGHSNYPWGNDPAVMVEWPLGNAGVAPFDVITLGRKQIVGLFSNRVEWTSSGAGFYPAYYRNLPFSQKGDPTFRTTRGGPYEIVYGKDTKDVNWNLLSVRDRLPLRVFDTDSRPGLGMRLARSKKPRLNAQDLEAVVQQ